MILWKFFEKKVRGLINKLEFEIEILIKKEVFFNYKFTFRWDFQKEKEIASKQIVTAIDVQFIEPMPSYSHIWPPQPEAMLCHLQGAAKFGQSLMALPFLILSVVYFIKNLMFSKIIYFTPNFIYTLFHKKALLIEAFSEV